VHHRQLLMALLLFALRDGVHVLPHGDDAPPHGDVPRGGEHVPPLHGDDVLPHDDGVLPHDDDVRVPLLHDDGEALPRDDVLPRDDGFLRDEALRDEALHDGVLLVGVLHDEMLMMIPPGGSILQVDQDEMILLVDLHHQISLAIWQCVSLFQNLHHNYPSQRITV